MDICGFRARATSVNNDIGDFIWDLPRNSTLSMHDKTLGNYDTFITVAE